MAASYPKPDGERRNRNAPAFGWTYLPRQHDHCPPLPRTRRWLPETRRFWRELWRKPEASQWDASGTSLRGYITMWDDVHRGDCTYASIAAECRQIEGLHGLSPKARLQLRWRVMGEEDGAQTAIDLTTGSGSSDARSASLSESTQDRRRRLRVAG